MASTVRRKELPFYVILNLDEDCEPRVLFWSDSAAEARRRAYFYAAQHGAHVVMDRDGDFVVTV
jgi:hypothetical protein